MAKKATTGNDGAPDSVGIEVNGSSGESSDAGIGGAAGGTSNAADAGSVGESSPRIAGLGVADPARVGTGEPGSEFTGGFNKDGSPTRKRGRKPGSGSARKSTSSKNSSDYKGLEKLLYSVHMMAAAALKTPEIAIDNKESEMLASAIGAVQEHYDFDVSEEVTIWVNLTSALVAVYGPRAFVIYSRKRREKMEKQPSASVTPIRPTEKATVPPGMNIPGMHEPTV